MIFLAHLQIELIALRPFRCQSERRVDGRGGEGAFAWRGKGAYRKIKSGDHARQQNQPLLLNPPLVALGQTRFYYGKQLIRLGTVTEYPMFDALMQRVDNRRRRAKIGIRHPQW